MMILATSSRVSRSTVCEPMSPAPPITARVFPRISMSFNQFETACRLAIALARARTDEIGTQPLAGAADPADRAGGHADHEREVGDVPRHHRAGSDEAVFAE